MYLKTVSRTQDTVWCPRFSISPIAHFDKPTLRFTGLITEVDFFIFTYLSTEGAITLYFKDLCMCVHTDVCIYICVCIHMRVYTYVCVYVHHLNTGADWRQKTALGAGIKKYTVI